MDEAEDAFGVPALKQPASARRVKLKAEGGTICPPFENFAKGRVALAELLQIVAGINGVGQHGNDIRDDEPPFGVVNGAAAFLALEQGDASFWILVCIGGQALQSKQFCLLSVNKEAPLGRASPGDDAESKM